MSSYEVRAIRFIHQVFPFIENCQTVDEYISAIKVFNKQFHRNVHCSNGLTRVALITSDYVIKIDYCPKQIRRWGGCEQEVKFYEMACREGYGYLFAKIKPYYYHGNVYYIMPRIHGVGRLYEDADEYMTEKECEWCWDHELNDLHCYNYGWVNNRVVIIDYSANGYREE